MGSLLDNGLAAAVLDALPDATAVLDGSGSIVAVNRAWQMFAVDNGGRPESTGVGVGYLDICTRAAASGCEDAKLASAGLRAVLGGASVDTELEYPCPSPDANRWFLLRITALAGPEPGAVASHINITRRKMAEETTAHQAAHDPLTGLANRTRFTAALTNALEPGSATLPDESFVGVLYLDLDRFKQVNDTLGHHVGDEVLVVTAHRLREVLRPQDTVARLGGDEFAVCAPDVTLAGLAALARQVDDALQLPHLLHGRQVHVPASVGTHLCSPGDAVDAVLQLADQDMFATKRTRAAGTKRALIQSVP